MIVATKTRVAVEFGERHGLPSLWGATRLERFVLNRPARVGQLE